MSEAICAVRTIRTIRTCMLGTLLCAALLVPEEGAKPVRTPAASAAPIDLDFTALARQRTRACPVQQAASVPVSTWLAESPQCAWQNRLRMRRWSGQGGAQGGCVSEQARWWSWAALQGGAPFPHAQTWHGAWRAHSLRDAGGAEQRIVIVRHLDDGRWQLTEWRWSPAPRQATRRWQEQRWALLAERAAALRQAPAPAGAASDAGRLTGLLERHLGARTGETDAALWQWQAAGLCLRADLNSLGPQQLQLPYSLDDNRLEQRAAMQLLLARRHPKGTWLTPFRLVPTAPRARGGAKFYAVWHDGGVLKGQLWIPTRSGAPMVRLRIDTPLAAVAGAVAQADALQRAAVLMEQELGALAARWASDYE